MRNKRLVRMSERIAATVIINFAMPAVSGQSFDVASVRAIVHRPGEKYGAEDVSAHPGSLSMKNVRLRACIKWAYDVKEYQLSGPDWLGSPGWMAVDRYNVVAKAAEGTPVPELRVMLRNLLAERFKLVLHRESKEMPVYALVVAKNGPKLHPSDPNDDGENVMTTKANALDWQRTSMSEFVEFMSGPLHIPVVDKTNLAGRFDFRVTTASYEPNVPGDYESEVTAAIQEQLGLKFERQKSKMDVLVVDHMEKRPAEN